MVNDILANCRGFPANFRLCLHLCVRLPPPISIFLTSRLTRSVFCNWTPFCFPMLLSSRVPVFQKIRKFLSWRSTLEHPNIRREISPWDHSGSWFLTRTGISATSPSLLHAVNHDESEYGTSSFSVLNSLLARTEYGPCREAQVGYTLLCSEYGRTADFLMAASHNWACDERFSEVLARFSLPKSAPNSV